MKRLFLLILACVACQAAPPNVVLIISDDQAWGEYLYYRKNIKGPQLERWFHAYGCRRWFNVARDSVTHEITAAYPMGAAPPADTGR